MFDVATGGLRLRAVKHKYEVAEKWDVWDTESPLGIMPGTSGMPKEARQPTAVRLKHDDVNLDSALTGKQLGGHDTEKSAVPSRLENIPEGARAVLRIHHPRFYKRNGSMRPTGYIARRVQALDGTPASEAIGKRFTDCLLYTSPSPRD